MNNINMPYKLIAVDLDKTLLDAEGKLSDRNRQALQRAMDLGIEVVPATGRARSTIIEDILAMTVVRYLICANGAVIIDKVKGEKIYQKIVPAEGIEDLWDLLQDRSFMKEYFYDGKPYVEEYFHREMGKYGVSDDFLAYYENTRVSDADMNAFLADKKDKIEVINFIFADKELRLRIRDRLEGNPFVETTSSLDFNLEIGAIGMSKGSALEFLAGFLGLKRGEIMAFGDNDNDISMIEFAGKGIAVENATAGAKSVADFITLSHDDDGVAHGMEKFIFSLY